MYIFFYNDLLIFMYCKYTFIESMILLIYFYNVFFYIIDKVLIFMYYLFYYLYFNLKIRNCKKFQEIVRNFKKL